jgi:hypothetical protein
VSPTLPRSLRPKVVEKEQGPMHPALRAAVDWIDNNALDLVRAPKALTVCRYPSDSKKRRAASPVRVSAPRRPKAARATPATSFGSKRKLAYPALPLGSLPKSSKKRAGPSPASSSDAPEAAQDPPQPPPSRTPSRPPARYPTKTKLSFNSPKTVNPVARAKQDADAFEFRSDESDSDEAPAPPPPKVRRERAYQREL